MYQPPAMRWRGVSVLTNTPPRRAQSQPGGLQGIVLMEPIIAKAARKLGHRSGGHPTDQRAGRQGVVRTAGGPKASEAVRHQRVRQGGAGSRAPSCSSGTSERRRAASGTGSKVRGVGVAMSAFVAGSIGFDGLFVIKPDGRHVHPVGHRQSWDRVGE